MTWWWWQLKQECWRLCWWWCWCAHTQDVLKLVISLATCPLIILILTHEMEKYYLKPYASQILRTSPSQQLEWTCDKIEWCCEKLLKKDLPLSPCYFNDSRSNLITTYSNLGHVCSVYWQSLAAAITLLGFNDTISMWDLGFQSWKSWDEKGKLWEVI